MPSALSYPMNMHRYNWGYETEPEEGLNNRRLSCPRGKVLGGSSSINGMIYVRWNAEDFNFWEESGARGWVLLMFCLTLKGKKTLMKVMLVGEERMGLCI